MRPEARIKCGFYPAPPQAVAHIGQHLRAPADGKRFAILDPCAGNGDAILQMGVLLGCNDHDIYAVELDNARGKNLSTTIGGLGGHVLAPCSTFGVGCPAGSFSFIWCNPPFDDEYGGGYRVERSFLDTATRWLKPRGIIALICPARTAESYDIRNVLRTWYDNVTVIPFPDECRRYNEVVVLAVKRAQFASAWAREYEDTLAPSGYVYEIPASGGPGSKFQKIQMTEDELIAAFDASPLNEHLKPPIVGELARPPLELGIGHLALLLASGHLDGLVCPPNEPPHVVRGTARKVEFIKDQERTEQPGGGVTDKTVFGQKIELLIRAVDTNGNIRTFTQSNQPPRVSEPAAPVLVPTRPERVESQPVATPATPAPQPVLVGDGDRAFDIS